MRSIQLMIIHKPDGYSANAAEEIAAPYRSETSSGNAKTPNVIAIMDEAFADLQAVGDFRTSEDVMPFYHSLTKHCKRVLLCIRIRRADGKHGI